MRKNKFMRAASGLLVAVLLTTCVISGTFAKYTTSAEGTDSARVAKWGFNNSATITLNGLFKNAYDETVNSDTKVIAPGTTNSQTFSFNYSEVATRKPEVAYTFEVSTEGSSISDDIANNANIQWRLDQGEWGTFSALRTSIEALDGNKAATTTTPANYYAPNTLPTEFDNNKTHTVQWRWNFDKNDNNVADTDTTDTAMGNKVENALDKVELKITVTATQVD